MGSQSDWPTMAGGGRRSWTNWSVPHETRIVSAHRTPDRMFAYAEAAAARGLKAIIAGAGGAAHLPGMLAAKTRVPVLGVPVQSKTLSGLDSLLSIVQMPRGVPVGTLAIGAAGAANAGLAGSGDCCKRRCWRCRPAGSLAGCTVQMPSRRSRSVIESLPPGSVIGILGGGQLGRMLSVAASRLGLKCIIFDPDAGAPAAQVAWRHVCAGYDDMAALDGFGAAVDVITYEFENIPTAALDQLEGAAPVRPGRRALAVSQDRLEEKRFLEGLGLSVAPYAAVESREELLAAVETVGTPSILKTRRLGYDGKGQVRLSGPGDVDAALEAVGDAPCVLEGFVDFEREISVIGARGLGWLGCLFRSR